MDFQNWETGALTLGVDLEQKGIRYFEHPKDGNEVPLEEKNHRHFKSRASLDGSVLPISHSLDFENHDGRRADDKAGYQSSELEENDSLKPGGFSDSENDPRRSGQDFLLNLETDSRVWLPPKPELLEDELDSVANYDDEDDDYSDGTKWSLSASFSNFDESLRSFSFKEERQKAMVRAMNGQFKILVRRLMSSEGFPEEVGKERWHDIVASLSWEAALLVKPDANVGRAMDPGSYVKVKCVATGSQSESQVIKGLVFKKNSAHKHMPTKHKNPRLLLLQGILGQHEVGLSSFVSMEQEKERLKSVTEMIENCHPNVVLVEKSASRDMQELLLSKGITLVFDMKLPRLGRIARSSGSHIISSADIPVQPKLKQCDSFRIEKIIEEHNTSGGGGRKVSKTLMFLEGFSKPLGCTILLKGANSDELKKVKRVMQYTIFAAYHLIVQTSFLVDQRTFFSNVNFIGDENHVSDDNENNELPPSPKSHHEIDSIVSTNVDSNQNGSMHFDSLVQPVMDTTFLPSFSVSFRRILSGGFPPLSSDTISTYFGFKAKNSSEENLQDLTAVEPMEVSNQGTEVNGRDSDEEGHDKNGNGERSYIIAESNASSEAHEPVKGNTESILDPQSILVLFSSQCITKQLVCQQSHLSRIKYYGDFDVTLGRYLEDILENKRNYCRPCGEPSEAHIYNYTHKNGKLSVFVRQIPKEFCLPGESEKKIWMWTWCLKCELESGITRSTRRVLMSNAAGGLSFGKFLDLSFSSHSAASRISSTCGHSLHRDCLRLFGMGSKVAMFRYSSIEIYAASKPPPVLEFSSPDGHEWLIREAKDVLERGEHFFSEVATMLGKLDSTHSIFNKEQSLDKKISVEGISHIRQMLMKDKAEFEAPLLKGINRNGDLRKTVNEILGLSWINQELLLELYIWDRRLHFLFSPENAAFHNSSSDGKSEPEKDVASSKEGSGIKTVECSSRTISDHGFFSPNGEDFQIKSSSEPGGERRWTTNSETEGTNDMGSDHKDGSGGNEHDIAALNVEPCVSLTNTSVLPIDKVFREEPSISDCAGDTAITNTDGVWDLTGIPMDFEIKASMKPNGSEFRSMSTTDYKKQRISEFEEPESWIWASLSELRRAYRNDLFGGHPQKFEFIHTYVPKYLSPMRQQLLEERDPLHFAVGPEGNVISVREDEISSIIACALALSEDRFGLLENGVEKDAMEIDGEPSRSINNSNLLVSGSSVASHLSSTSLDTEGALESHSGLTLRSEDLPHQGSEGSTLVDRLIALEDLHPEIPVGIDKQSRKSKYSVICVHANEFYDLRRMCCPSELAYISSLSRCKKWNAQGGKTKSMFAKSLDDRFIVKQIKKIELDSFLKFAPEYFKHISYSLRTGSQTCLAKILGIYQVRQNIGGKEVKIDLMVMENLLYGRNVARTYDLKGAVFSRYISDSNDPGKVLLDQNFVEDTRVSPMYVNGRTKHLLQRAIWNDTAFLTSINVMDYSLLVGVDRQRHELVFGIIDYLRQYTWDKQLETWVKSSLVVPKNELPTVISPREYKKRFRKFMSQYFLTVPDSWSSEQCQDPCKFCEDGSSKAATL